MGLSESHCCEGSEEDKTQTGAENGSKLNPGTSSNKVLVNQNKESDVDQPNKWHKVNQQDSTLITESVNIPNDSTNTDQIPNLQETPAKKEKPFQFDPRSPSSAVDRTPITINKKADRLGSSIDPRSPSVEIQRTPVVLPETPEIAADQGDKNKVKSNGIFDPRSPSNQIVRTPLRVKETGADNLRKEVLISNALIPADNENVSQADTETTAIIQTPTKPIPADPRSPSGDITRTPISGEGIKLNPALLDPRSPTVGIQRTPILAEDLEEELVNEEIPSETEILTDPRSPSVEIDRTPLKVNKCDEDEQDRVVVPEVTITSDATQTTEFTRTPLKLPVTENLRRTVLLSNTFMPSPAKTENQTQNDDHNDKDECSKSGLLSEQLLNLSVASNLNYSHTSSTFATCDSDSVHMDSFDDEQEDLTLDEAESSSFGNDWQDNDDMSACDGDSNDYDGRTSFSQTAISNFVEEMIRQLAPQEADESKEAESSQIGSHSLLLETSTLESRVELLANRSLPVQKQQRKPVIDADMPKQRRASESERSTSSASGERTKLKLKLQKPSPQQQSIYKRSQSEKCIATSAMAGKTAPRLPLSVLGHSNSPDVIKPKLATGPSKSRLPRYRGKQRRSLGGTPPHFSAPLDTTKFGKEN